MASAEELQGLHLNTYQRATKIHVDLSQDGYEVETRKSLSYEAKGKKKRKKTDK